MAAFSAPFGAGIAFLGRVPSTGLNSINADLPKAPNFVDGDAEYTPTIAVTVGGGGIWIKSTGWRLLSGSQISNYGGSFVGQTGISGITATGGASGGHGVQAQGGAGGTGITATGGSLAAGGVFNGGASGANGVIATATGNGAGGVFTGNGSGAGITATGGATGKGIVCDSGSSTVAAIDIGTGNAIFTGAQPSATADPGADHYLCPTNICKAWAMVSTDGAGSVTLNDGYNIASVSVTTTYVLVTFARAFASTNYAPVATDCGAPSAIPWVDWATRSTTTLRISFQQYGGGAVNPATNVVRFGLHVMGRQ